MGLFDATMLVSAGLAVWLAWLLAPKFVARQPELLQSVHALASSDWIGAVVLLVSAVVVALGMSALYPVSAYAEIYLLPLASIALVVTGAYLRISWKLLAALIATVFGALLVVNIAVGLVTFVGANGSAMLGESFVVFEQLGSVALTSIDLAVRCGLCILAGRLTVFAWERRAVRARPAEGV